MMLSTLSTDTLSNIYTGKRPLVSVCIPAYNCAAYIGDTLRCLCAQEYIHIEIIVVNDGSVDSTLTVAKGIPDERIKLIDVVNGGAARARNIAYAHSTGDYIIFFDADDLVGPGFITAQLQAVLRYPDSIAISAWGRFYRKDGSDFTGSSEPLSTPHTLEQWIISNWYHSQHNTPPGRMMLPRSLVEKAGQWNEQLSLNDDFEFFTRVALAAKMIIPVSDAVYCYRSGVNGLSSKKTDQAYISLFLSMKLSFEQVLAVYGRTEMVRRACANLWQAYIYEVYPGLREQRSYAKQQIRLLGGSDFSFPAGGMTRLLTKLVGWRIVKYLKNRVK